MYNLSFASRDVRGADALLSVDNAHILLLST